MDQTPLPLVLDDGKTFDKKVVKEVWAQSGQSDLDERQATVELTVLVITNESRSCIGVIKRL